MTQTHWKQLVNIAYIGAYSLSDGQDLTVTITGIKREMVKGTGGKEEECTVATLKDQKPLILNRTNCRTIQKIYNTPIIENWIGKKITLFATTTKVAGETVECLRIRPLAPKLPDLNPDSPKWAGAVEAIANKSTTIEAIKKAYSLTADNERLLIKDAI